MRECIFLKNAAPVSHRTAGQARQPAVNVQTGGTIKVAALEIRSTQETPHAHRLRPSKSLRRPHATGFGVFKRCQHPLEYLCGPHNIIIDEHGDPSLHFRYRPAHLPAFVCLSYAQDTDLLGIDFVRQLGQSVKIGIDGDQYQLKWLSLEAGFESCLELIAALGDGRQDDGDILRGVGWVFGYGNRPVGPV